MQAKVSNPQRRVLRWPLWSLLWRLLIFGPIIMTTGLVAFGAVITSIVGPPFYVIVLVVGQQYVLALLVVALWLACLPWAIRLWKWMMQGVAYAGL